MISINSSINFLLMVVNLEIESGIKRIQGLLEVQVFCIHKKH